MYTVAPPYAFRRSSGLTRSSRHRDVHVVRLALTLLDAFHGVYFALPFLHSKCSEVDGQTTFCGFPQLFADKGFFFFSMMQNVYSKNPTIETITTSKLRACLEHLYSHHCLKCS
jgi:hypothetical protein